MHACVRICVHQSWVLSMHLVQTCTARTYELYTYTHARTHAPRAADATEEQTLSDGTRDEHGSQGEVRNGDGAMANEGVRWGRTRAPSVESSHSNGEHTSSNDMEEEHASKDGRREEPKPGGMGIIRQKSIKDLKSLLAELAEGWCVRACVRACVCV